MQAIIFNPYNFNRKACLHEKQASVDVIVERLNNKSNGCGIAIIKREICKKYIVVYSH